MTFKELKLKIKIEQKKLSRTIRILKSARKPKIYSTNPKKYNSLGNLETHQYNFRHTHIAYCTFFNNTPYEKIEKICLEDPYDFKINKLKKQWDEIIQEANNEALCISAQ